jgi:NDP-sugar pyrophosphorylase family protein
MNKSPVVALHSLEASAIEKMMVEHELSSIPVVDEAGVYIRLQKRFESQSAKKIRRQNPVFIMAGGFGSRLHPLTNECPKPMLEINGKPILHSIIDSFIKSGYSNFYISTHFLANVIIDYFGDGSRFGVSIKYVHEETPLGTGGALALLPKDLPDLPLIMINGDIVTDLDYEGLMRYHESGSSSATICLRKFTYKVPFGVINMDEKNLVVDMVEKPEHVSLINAGIYVIDPNIIKSVEPYIYTDMPTALTSCMEKGMSIQGFLIHENWIDVGQHADLENAKENAANKS